jgi:hypothetical protein
MAGPKINARSEGKFRLQAVRLGLSRRRLMLTLAAASAATPHNSAGRVLSTWYACATITRLREIGTLPLGGSPGTLSRPWSTQPSTGSEMNYACYQNLERIRGRYFRRLLDESRIDCNTAANGLFEWASHWGAGQTPRAIAVERDCGLGCRCIGNLPSHYDLVLRKQSGPVRGRPVPAAGMASIL